MIVLDYIIIVLYRWLHGASYKINSFEDQVIIVMVKLEQKVSQPT